MGKCNTFAASRAAQNPVTNASARPPEYPPLLNPPPSAPETRSPGRGSLSGVKARPATSMAMPPYVNVILK